MMTFYAAAGSYQIRSEDGKNMPYIMRLGKLQPVSIPEFSLWSMLLWDVLTYEELHKKFYDKMEETEIEPSSFDKSLEMLVKRKLIIKGVGYTGADALYNMLSDTYVIPLRGVQGTRKLMNVAKLLKQKKVNFFEAVYCTFRFVVNTKYGNQDNASFFNCTASEYIANRMQKAGIKKGRLIEIIGNLNLRPYEKDEGIRQISADVGVLEWHFTGSKPKGDEADSSQGTAKTAQKSTGKVRPEQTIPSGDDDDDLPL